MKIRYLFLLMIIGLTGLFSSCEGPMGAPGPQGEPGAYWDVFDMTVKGEHWEWDSDREAFYYFFNEPAITNLIAREGIVQVAIRVNDTYHPLPYVRHLYENGYVTETVNYEYGAGWIRFNFSANDLFEKLPENYKPGTHVFKITLLWQYH